MSRPRAAYHAQLRGEVSSEQVLRALMEHPGWLVPLRCFEGDELASARKVCFSPRAQVPVGELWLFTETGTAQQATIQGSSLGTYVAGVPGMVLFQRLQHSAELIRVNPGGWEEDAFSFDAGARPILAAWAKTVQLERFLGSVAEPGSNASLLARLRSHDGYRVPLLPDGRMVARPGHDGFQQPSVVCTSVDSYQAFVALLPPEMANTVHCEVLNGDGLASMVSRQRIDALYLNPAGPGPTRTLPRDVGVALASANL